MEEITPLKSGDVFCTIFSTSKLSLVINAVQKFHSFDNESSYSHTGIITNSKGTTLESLWTVRYGNLEQYLDRLILIGRHQTMTDQRAKIALKLMSDAVGRYYPVHRLFFHLIPPLAKYASTGNYMVCSELVASFLYICRVQQFYKGVTPDQIADIIKNHRLWRIIYEGYLTDAVLRILQGEGQWKISTAAS